MSRCPGGLGHARHWFSVHGQVHLRSPVCVRCGEPNPKPLTDEQWSDLRSFFHSYPTYLPSRVVTAMREAGEAGQDG